MSNATNAESRRKAACEASRRYRERHVDLVRARQRRKRIADPKRVDDKHRRWYQKTKDNPLFKQKARALARRAYGPRREKQILAMTGGRPRPTICEVCDRCPSRPAAAE